MNFIFFFQETIFEGGRLFLLCIHLLFEMKCGDKSNAI